MMRLAFIVALLLPALAPACTLSVQSLDTSAQAVDARVSNVGGWGNTVSTDRAGIVRMQQIEKSSWQESLFVRYPIPGLTFFDVDCRPGADTDRAPPAAIQPLQCVIDGDKVLVWGVVNAGNRAVPHARQQLIFGNGQEVWALTGDDGTYQAEVEFESAPPEIVWQGVSQTISHIDIANSGQQAVCTHPDVEVGEPSAT